MADKNGPQSYTGDTRQELEKYVVDRNGSIPLLFVDKNGNIYTECEIAYRRDFGLTIFDRRKQTYFSCLSLLRVSYTKDVETWDRFMLIADDGKPAGQSLKEVLGVAPGAK